MRVPIGSMPAAAGLVATFLLALCTAADASEPGLEAEDRQERNRQLLRLVTRPETDLEAAIAVPRSAFELDRRGLRYRSDLTLGGRDLELRIGGPIYKSVRQKRFGVIVELRF